MQMFAFATSTIETVEQVSREARQSRRRGAVSEGGKSKVKTLRSALNENDIYQIRSALERKLKEYGEDKRSNGVFVAALKCVAILFSFPPPWRLDVNFLEV